MPETYFKISHSQIIQETFDDEVVIVDLIQGTYFSLAGSGSEIWNAALRGEPHRKIIAQLQENTDGAAGEIETATQQFLQQLQDEGLLVVADQESLNGAANSNAHAASAQQISESREFVAPQLQKFSDMQALLMLDPIHEVDEAGWPVVKATPEKVPTS